MQQQTALLGSRGVGHITYATLANLEYSLNIYTYIIKQRQGAIKWIKYVKVLTFKNNDDLFLISQKPRVKHSTFSYFQFSVFLFLLSFFEFLHFPFSISVPFAVKNLTTPNGSLKSNLIDQRINHLRLKVSHFRQLEGKHSLCVFCVISCPDDFFKDEKT